jgi:hypothetical protein
VLQELTQKFPPTKQALRELAKKHGWGIKFRVLLEMVLGKIFA